jgi:hypothetical protein
VQIGPPEIPIVVVRLVEDVEPVQPFHPAELHLDIEVLRIGGGVPAAVVDQLVGPDGIVVGHDGPIVGVAVDPRNLVGGELKDLEGDIRPVERSRRVAGENEEDHQGQAEQMGGAVQQRGTEIFHGGNGCSPDRKNESQSKRLHAKPNFNPSIFCLTVRAFRKPLLCPAELPSL